MVCSEDEGAATSLCVCMRGGIRRNVKAAFSPNERTKRKKEEKNKEENEEKSIDERKKKERRRRRKKKLASCLTSNSIRGVYNLKPQLAFTPFLLSSSFVRQ